MWSGRYPSAKTRAVQAAMEIPIHDSDSEQVSHACIGPRSIRSGSLAGHAPERLCMVVAHLAGQRQLCAPCSCACIGSRAAADSHSRGQLRLPDARRFAHKSDVANGEVHVHCDCGQIYLPAKLASMAVNAAQLWAPELTPAQDRSSLAHVWLNACLRRAQASPPPGARARLARASLAVRAGQPCVRYATLPHARRTRVSLRCEYSCLPLVLAPGTSFFLYRRLGLVYQVPGCSCRQQGREPMFSLSLVS